MIDVMTREHSTKTLKMIEVTTREHSVSSALVFERYRRFSDGQDGRSRKKQNTMIVTSICDALVADRRLMIRELAELFDMGCGAIH